MKRFLIFIAIFFISINQCFAYYTIEQIKYEQSKGEYTTLNRVMENPTQMEKVYYNYYNQNNNNNNNNDRYRDSYNNPNPYVQEKPLYKFGN